MGKKLQEKIDEVFSICSGSLGTTDFKSISKYLWMSLNNALSLVDLAGVYTITVPSGGVDSLNAETFGEFFKALARIKYPADADFCEKLAEEIRTSKGSRLNVESTLFTNILDKAVVRVLLKYDLPLRRAYSNFCGQSVRVGGILSWDEVKSMSIGMEIDGFISFVGTYSIVPGYSTTQRCELLFRDVLHRYPLLANAASMSASILYPQFQLLLIMLVADWLKAAVVREDSSEKVFAKKVLDAKNRPFSEALNEFMRTIGISKHDSDAAEGGRIGGAARAVPHAKQSGNKSTSADANLFSGTVVAPFSDRPEDVYSASLNQGRQAMMLRMEHLFDEIRMKALEMTSPGPDPDIEELLVAADSTYGEVKARLPSKPVVIGDAIPVPNECPKSVEQLLEAALAHHNLGSYEESLKFLEAAKIQLADVEHQSKRDQSMKSSGGMAGSEKRGASTSAPQAISVDDPRGVLFFDLRMYITLCKGNVYQSCGDDEQSLINFMEGWTAAQDSLDKDWEIICMNSMGMLAYYNLRYDVALICFNIVANYRNMAYGEANADTATAVNNEAACLYCLQRRGEARLRFEKSWAVLSETLGHRAPRSVTAWKNLEKARRSHAPLRSGSRDMHETIQMRTDADRLLLGGSFTIQAIPPPEAAKKKRKGGKKGGKKK